MKLDKILKNLRLRRCTKEPFVYQKTEGNNVLIIAVYVHDLFVTGTSLGMIKRFKREMGVSFEISNLRKLTYYLEIKVK